MSAVEVVYEDNHLFVVNKACGLLTQPTNEEKESLEDDAKFWLKTTHAKPGAVFLHPIHRLDKPVSGIVVFAKTSKALQRLNESVRLKETRKIYWAWVEGVLVEDGGTLEHYLLHDDFHAKVVDERHPKGKKASLSFRVLERRKNSTLIEVELFTGRYHQIRLQLAHSGHPVIGDRKYGSTWEYEMGAIALHHRLFEIAHPITKERMVFEASPPIFFQRIA
jgi:23S rRNA pseudouridine1911/1915/1917 synthase